MKKYILFLLLVFTLPNVHAEDFRRAQRILDLVKLGQGDSLVAQFHPDVKKSLPVAVVSHLWEGLLAQSGDFKKQMDWTAARRDTLLLQQCNLVFESESVQFSLMTDDDQHIVGIHFSPIAHLFDSLSVDEKKMWAYREKDTLLVNRRVKLPAVFCRPSEMSGKVPVVVFINDIGPYDKDATFGPNKPFREVAHRLAKRGIASLRYDTRTFVYGSRTQEIGGVLTYDTEIVDDAIAALETVSRFEEVDAQQLYVVGHSVGGMLAPRIAMLSRVPLAGMISVAGVARPLKDVLHAQLRYMAKLQGGSVAQADSVADMMYAKLSMPYRTFAAAYNPVGTARGLRIPMLFMQGGHDFKVTEADFDLWKKGLENIPNAKFVWLEKCDHLFREQPVMSVPGTYMLPGRISTEAINAVATFIRENSGKE